MPYITKPARVRINARLRHVHNLLDTPGALAYAVYMLLKEYVARQGGNYSAYAGAIGVLYTSLHKFIRQSLNAYEDEKRRQNGAIK